MSATVVTAQSKAQPQLGEAKATSRGDLILFVLFAVVVFTAPIWTDNPILDANYPDLLQRFAIFGVFAIGFNLLFGLTGYLSFGHAAFLGIGSYAAVWGFKLLGMNALFGLVFAMVFSAIFAVAIGYVSLRRSGIYFSILTLAFAQMFYSLAYSVLVPLTNGETGLRVLREDLRFFDDHTAEYTGTFTPHLFGLEMSGYNGFYFCAVILLVAFYFSIRIFRSPFGLMLRAIKTNQNRLNYTGVNTRPYMLTVFVISGLYAGLAGGMMAVTDPLAGAERMQWTASGEVVLMTILGGSGTLLGPMLGVFSIKWIENNLSAFNKGELTEFFSFLPEGMVEPMVSVTGLFVGEGWHLTLGVLFMLVVIFLPGGMMEGIRRISNLFAGRRRRRQNKAAPEAAE